MVKKREKKEEKKKGRRPCCVGDGVRKGAWTAEEDKILVDFITENGHGTWRNLPKLAGLLRCGKSCRLRWTNYLRPGIKRGPFSPEEENTIIHLHGLLGNKWAAIASRIPGRTDNDVKNFWNSHLRKRFSSKIHHPSSSSKSADLKSDSPPTHHLFHWESVGVEADSRLSNNPSPLDAPNCSKTTGDYFISLWNSKVGESFRSINESRNECGGDASHSPTSQTSSLTKVESGCRSTNLTKLEVWNSKRESEDVNAAYSDSSKSFEIDDSADAMLKLLLDFPVGSDDMGFLEAPSDDLTTYIQD